MTTPQGEGAQRTYDRRRARAAAEILASIPPNRWDDMTRQIVCTLATIAAPSRIDDLLEAFDGEPADHLVELVSPPTTMCLRGHGHGNAELAGACDLLPGAHVAASINAYDSGSLHTDHALDDTRDGPDTPDIRVAMAGELRRMGLMGPEPLTEDAYDRAATAEANERNTVERKCLDPDCTGGHVGNWSVVRGKPRVHDNGDYHA